MEVGAGGGGGGAVRWIGRYLVFQFHFLVLLCFVYV